MEDGISSPPSEGVGSPEHSDSRGRYRCGEGDLYRQLLWTSVLGADEVLSTGLEVIKHILLVQQRPRLPPLYPILPSTPARPASQLAIPDRSINQPQNGPFQRQQSQLFVHVGDVYGQVGSWET